MQRCNRYFVPKASIFKVYTIKVQREYMLRNAKVQKERCDRFLLGNVKI